MKPQLLLTLIYSAELSRERLGSSVTTKLIAERLGVSQQTASRRLIELERLGQVSRIRVPGGERIKLTRQGWTELKNLYAVLGGLIEPYTGGFTLKGIVFTGLGEGAYYVSQQGYLRQFHEKLGFKPYPGTLNLKLIGSYISERKLLDRSTPITMEGFKCYDRSFGAVKCYRASLNDSELCVVITALRTHYGEETLEIIAPQNLRERLKLKDGDTVTVRVFATPQQPSS